MAAQPSKSSGRKLTAIAICVVLAVAAPVSAASGLDAWIADVCRPEHLPGDVKKSIGMFEVFGHGTGVVLAALLVGVLGSGDFRTWARVLASGFLAGIVAVCIKPWVTRIRPSRLAEFTSPTEMTVSGGRFVGVRWTGSPELDGDVVGNTYGFFHDALHAFPSGHSATACALAVCLANLYPDGRFVFWWLAVMVMVQRVCAQAHYVSDTLTGALLGLGVGMLVNRWFGLRARQPPPKLQPINVSSSTLATKSWKEPNSSERECSAKIGSAKI